MGKGTAVLINLSNFSILFNEFNMISFHGQAFLILLGVYTLTVVALPLYFIFSLKRSGYIESYEMHTLKERRLPLLFTSGAMLFNYYLMQRANMLGIYQIYFLTTVRNCCEIWSGYLVRKGMGVVL